MGTLQQKLQSDAQARIIDKYAALGYTPEQITRAIASDPAYQAIIKDYGIGGKYWTMSASFTTALAGLMGGNIQGAAVGAAAPYLANLVKQISDGDEPLRMVLHTALGAFLAAAQGGNATAGAAGALAGTATAGIAKNLARLLFNSGPNDTLTEDQKQVIDNLVVIAGSVAGGVAGGGLSGVGSGVNTAKNEVENNSLSCTPLTCKAGVDLNGGSLVGGGGAGAAAGAGLGTIIAGLFGHDNTPTPTDTGDDQTAGQSPTSTGGNQQLD